MHDIDKCFRTSPFLDSLNTVEALMQNPPLVQC